MATTRLVGWTAIEAAERGGQALSKHADPTDGARDGLSVDEAHDRRSAARGGAPMTARAPRVDSGPAAITAELRRDIGAAIEAAGLSQRRLSAASGVAQSNISLALSGATDPCVSTVDLILEATGHRLMVDHRPLSEILDGATDPPLSAVVRLLDGLGHRLHVEQISDGP